MYISKDLKNVSAEKRRKKYSPHHEAIKSHKPLQLTMKYLKTTRKNLNWSNFNNLSLCNLTYYLANLLRSVLLIGDVDIKCVYAEVNTV